MADVSTVRLLIADMDAGDKQLLTDDNLTALLTLHDGNVFRASADALRVIAASEVLVSKAIRTQDLSTDGAKVSAELRALAATYDAKADAAEAEAFFEFVDGTPSRPEATEWGGW